MKAAALMIGDWVCLKDDIKCELPLKVDGVLTDDISLEGEGFLGGAEGLISSIPITPEILEKNGFVFVKSSGMDTVWNGWWIYENLELGTCCLDRESNWPCCINIDDMNIDCEYVHQLQHALRLCEIGGLADNFKI